MNVNELQVTMNNKLNIVVTMLMLDNEKLNGEDTGSSGDITGHEY